jgi:hypothetical protein
MSSENIEEFEAELRAAKNEEYDWFMDSDMRVSNLISAPPLRRKAAAAACPEAP